MTSFKTSTESCDKEQYINGVSKYKELSFPFYKCPPISMLNLKHLRTIKLDPKIDLLIN